MTTSVLVHHYLGIFVDFRDSMIKKTFLSHASACQDLKSDIFSLKFMIYQSNSLYYYPLVKTCTLTGGGGNNTTPF